MSKHSRQTLTLLAIPAVALGTAVATGQTLPQNPTAVIEAVTDVTPAQFRERGRRGGRAMQFLQEADTDGDNALTQAEIDAFIAAQLTTADADSNGTVDLAEFETFYNQRTRDRTVDAFQRLDDDGDGIITAAELDERFGTIVQRMDRNGDGAISREDRRRGGERRGDRRERRGDR